MESKYKLNTLRHWYLGEYEWKGEKVLLAYGRFFNRPGLYEGMKGHTSVVQSVKISGLKTAGTRLWIFPVVVW